MNEIILSKLDEIERAENVKIIHAIESGSRAWGFASPDSDYDVRFIYIRPMEYYLKLEQTRDVIEWQIDEVLDINGWDLQKALRLLYKSNPTIFEWNNSPLIYKTTPEWGVISKIIEQYFQSINGLHHYFNMAKTNYREYLKADEVRFKKYFYVIRPILACKWILDKNTPPPMLFSELCDAELSDDIKPEVDRLLEIKINSPEIAKGKRVDKLNEYIEKSIADIEYSLSNIQSENFKDWDTLNKMFLNIIKNQ